MSRFRLLIFLGFLSVAACRPSDPAVIGSISLDEYTPEQEKLIGDALDLEFQENLDLITPTENPEAHEYLQQMMSLVVNTATVTRRNVFENQISIIRNDSRRGAFILPNGHLYFYTGFLKYIESESQLLSVIAHEIAYAEKGYAVRALEDEFSPKELGDLILDNGRADTEAMAAIFPDLSYSVSQVAEADNFAIEVLCPFLYEARGTVHLIEKAEENPDDLPLWFSLRPSEDLENRKNTINLQAQDCGLDGVKNESEYQAFADSI